MFRYTLVCALLAPAWLLAAGSVIAEESLSLEQLRAARKEAAHRPRRIIFNNDGNEPVYLCKDTTPEELLRHRTTPLANTHVDTIFYCTWSSGFGMFTHDTQVGHVFDTKAGIFKPNIIDKMLAAGTDPLQVMVDFGAKNDVEIFWSFRMNDTHDASLASYGPVMFAANPLKQSHPEWLIGTPKNRPKYGGWSAVDFAQPEIRDLAVGYVQEVCQNYDVQGIELDFFRHPVFFKRAAQAGGACNDEERAMMTEMVRRIRQVTEQEGLKKNKPILLSVRVPDSIGYCRDCGIDIEAWLEEGLIDLMTVSGYFRLRPWADSVALGDKYDVPVYPSLDESRVQEPAAKKARMTIEAYRGRALAARGAGMAGLNLFNSFDPHAPVWRELGDPELLAKQDHDYFASIRGVGAVAGGALSHRKYQEVSFLNPKASLNVTPERPATARFEVGVDYPQLETDAPPQIMLRLQFAEPLPSSLDVKLNGAPLQSTATTGGWLECLVEPDQLQLGVNQVTVTLTDDQSPVRWLDLQCTVRWNETK